MLTLVVKQLNKERAETEKRLDSIKHAIQALTGNEKSNGRVLSADARRRISIAQRKRWAKFRKAA